MYTAASVNGMVVRVSKAHEGTKQHTVQVTLKASRSCTGRSLMKPTVSDMMADAPLGSVTACEVEATKL
jgi:hypothetical protein